MKKIIMLLMVVIASSACAQNEAIVAVDTNTGVLNWTDIGVTDADYSTLDTMILPTNTFIAGINLKNSARTNRFLIKSLSDLPASTNGGIQLQNGTYEFNGFVDIGTNELFGADVALLVGDSRFQDGIIYSGTNFIICSTGSFASLSHLSLTATNGGIGLFENISTPTNSVILDHLRISECVTAFVISNIFEVEFDSVAIFKYTTTNSCITVFPPGTGLLTAKELFILSPGENSVGFEFGVGSYTLPSIHDSFIRVASNGVGVLAVTNSANVATNGIGSIRNTVFASLDPSSVPIEGITVSDTRWDLSNNVGVPTSQGVSSMYITNDVTISIDFVNTPVKVDTDWFVGDQSGFIVTTNGTMTYNKVIPRTVGLSMNCAMEPVSGVRDLAVHIFKNGVSLPLAEMSLPDISSAIIFPTITTINVELGDTIEVFVENKENNSNIKITRIQFIAGG